MLFLLGGLVRSTGSGMGCPDWPRCFGLLAPPTCECQLPRDYQQRYLEKRIDKVNRFATTLEKFGMTEKAAALRADKSILEPEAFNVSKAWIEYINRIFGVISGLLGVAFVALAVVVRNKRSTRIYAIGGFLMLVLNAWLGSIVVATNLLPGIVTLHFLLSFLCVFLFMLSLHAAHPFASEGSGKDTWKWVLLFSLILLEVMLGTAARETVEAMQASGKWLNGDGMMDYKGMGNWFAVHRFLPGLVLILSLIFGIMNGRKKGSKTNPFYYLTFMVLLQIAFGAVNIVYALPAYSQVLHITIGSVLPVFCFYYILAGMAFHKNKMNVVTI